MLLRTKSRDLLMSNEIVKYHNDLNTVVMRKWTSEEMNFFFTIIAKARDEGTKLMKFNADELRGIASKEMHLPRWSQTMRSVADKVVDLKYYERTEHSYLVMNLFSYFRVDELERTVEVEVSSKFEYIINKLEVQFTQYELEEFTNIRKLLKLILGKLHFKFIDDVLKFRRHLHFYGSFQFVNSKI